MTDPLVLTEKEDGVCLVTLNRPEALNALSSALRAALAETLAELAEDPETQVIILTGAGRAFTVGLDLKELGGEVDAASTTTSLDLSEAMDRLPQPVIGAINGFAITGGFELALMCDFLIASPEAKFADTHARVGVVPGWGLSQRLPRLIGINRAKELSLTGNFLEAATAEAWGLVNRVVPVDELLPVARSLARDIVSTEPVTRGEILRIMDEGWATNLDEGLKIELAANRAHSKREVRAEKVAERRAEIQKRGRSQSAG
jgi:enoyl-CoA hydratase